MVTLTNSSSVAHWEGGLCCTVFKSTDLGVIDRNLWGNSGSLYHLCIDQMPNCSVSALTPFVYPRLQNARLIFN